MPKRVITKFLIRYFLKWAFAFLLIEKNSNVK